MFAPENTYTTESGLQSTLAMCDRHLRLYYTHYDGGKCNISVPIMTEYLFSELGLYGKTDAGGGLWDDIAYKLSPTSGMQDGDSNRMQFYWDEGYNGIKYANSIINYIDGVEGLDENLRHGVDDAPEGKAGDEQDEGQPILARDDGFAGGGLLLHEESGVRRRSVGSGSRRRTTASLRWLHAFMIALRPIMARKKGGLSVINALSGGRALRSPPSSPRRIRRSATARRARFQHKKPSEESSEGFKLRRLGSNQRPSD